MAYYYLVSSLVPLSIDQPVPYTPEAFFETHKHMLTSKDRVNLEHVISNRLERVKNPFINNWQNFEIQLKRALARVRIAQSNTDLHTVLTEENDLDSSVVNAVHEAMNQPNPLKKELALDSYRWQFLDEHVPNYSFEIQAIFSYTLKLKIANRWQMMKDKKGRETVVNLLEEKFQTTNQQGLLTTDIS